jgi:hypothetical protein
MQKHCDSPLAKEALIKSPLKFGRICATQKPGYPLQFGRFAAKFRFYPLRVSSSDAVFVINHRFLKAIAQVWADGGKRERYAVLRF